MTTGARAPQEQGDYSLLGIYNRLWEGPMQALRLLRRVVHIVHPEYIKQGTITAPSEARIKPGCGPLLPLR